VAGTLPLAVVVGRADAMDVLVHGQSFDLTPVVRDNVARFQIK
jgi:cytoskeleton protein RodZ